MRDQFSAMHVQAGRTRPGRTRARTPQRPLRRSPDAGGGHLRHAESVHRKNPNPACRQARCARLGMVYVYDANEFAPTPEPIPHNPASGQKQGEHLCGCTSTLSVEYEGQGRTNDQQSMAWLRSTLKESGIPETWPGRSTAGRISEPASERHAARHQRRPNWLSWSSLTASSPAPRDTLLATTPLALARGEPRSALQQPPSRLASHPISFLLTLLSPAICARLVGEMSAQPFPRRAHSEDMPAE